MVLFFNDRQTKKKRFICDILCSNWYYVIIDGKKTKEFWNGKIVSKEKPLRIKIRNISGDEVVVGN